MSELIQGFTPEQWQKGLPLECMKKLDFVRWDRFAGLTPECIGVFGWIRGKKQRDFAHIITMYGYPSIWGTSSARRSEQFHLVCSEFKGGHQQGTPHELCIRVEHHCDLPNVVKL